MENGIKIVRMRQDQVDLMTQIFSLSDDARSSLIAVLSKSGSMRGLGDYKNWLQDQISPSEGFIKPYGPANFPTNTPASKPKDAIDGLEKIHAELVRQRTPTRPLIRSKLVDQNGITLDWTANGQMSRLMIRNKGPNSIWMAFDQKGASVDNFTSNNSVEVQANESWNVELCAFAYLGLKAGAGNTGTAHAIAFPSNSGMMAGSVG